MKTKLFRVLVAILVCAIFSANAVYAVDSE